LGDKALLKNAIGRPSCINTAPRPDPEASVSTTKVLEKSGKAKTGKVVMANFKVSNALEAASVHTNAPFFSKSVRGRAKAP